MSVLRRRLMMDLPTNLYIQDGLVLLLDGVYNTRYKHESTPEHWEDLSGNGNDFYNVYDNMVTFGPNYADFSTQTVDDPIGFRLDKNFYPELIPGTEVTVEVVEQITNRPASNYNVTINSNTDNFSIFAGSYPDIRTECYMKIPGNRPNVGVITTETSTPVFSVSLSASDSIRRGYLNGELKSNNEGTQTSISTANYGIELTIGGRGNGFLIFNGKIFSLRFYNRVLSYDEMFHNYTVDQRRFNL